VVQKKKEIIPNGKVKIRGFAKIACISEEKTKTLTNKMYDKRN